MEDLVNRRCGWAGTDDLYVKYHDEEWGRLVTDDKTLFEFLVLESAQAGLAWITILRKREGYKNAIQKEFGSFYNYTLSFFPEQKPIVNNFKSLKEIPITTPESDAMSKDMKKRGFKFFGSTICYAHMQATGFVNDHLEGCFCREKIFTDCSV